MDTKEFKELIIEAQLSDEELKNLCDGILKYGIEYGEKYLMRKVNERTETEPVNRNGTAKDIDAVNPSHYKMKNGVECFDVMVNAFGREAVYNFCLCNAFKYLFRLRHKDTENINVQKAQWYINKAVALKRESSDKPKA